jgi:DNA topoisomerase-3
MRICPDRECGYRKSVAIVTNARCPNCHKELELRGEGEGRLFTCICGYRERMGRLRGTKAAAGANKSEVKKIFKQTG